jgi:hypothetical protein
MVVLVVVVLVVDVVGGTVVDEGATVVDVRDALGETAGLEQAAATNPATRIDPTTARRWVRLRVPSIERPLS